MQKKRKVWNTVLICLLTAVLAAGSGALSAKENTEEAEQEQQDQSASDEEQKTEMSSTAEIEQEEETKLPKKKKKTLKSLAKDSRTLLDVSKKSVRIKATGAAGGGLAQEESRLNTKGYRITGTTAVNKIIVDPGVTTDIIFDHLSITNKTRSENCVTVSRANVTITLIGENKLSCEKRDYGALVKDGMDNTALILQCEHSKEQGHKCRKETCGSLEVGGTTVHVTAIGSTVVNREKADLTGFSNLYIKGGIIAAQAGEHNCAIGSACASWCVGKGYTKNIRISGGIVTASGGVSCAGIGSGSWTPTDGIYITGGNIYASGGTNAAGIGSGGHTGAEDGTYGANVNVSNVVISGGDTVVTALGDKSTNMPGIGCGTPPDNKPQGTITNVIASPDTGFQGYIQDGTSETDYNFTKFYI